MTADLRLGLTLGYWGPQPPADAIELAKTAERFNYDSVWTAEAYGSDVFTPLAWVAANTKSIKLGTGIAQISARTPVATAMTAMTLDYLSGGRLMLGLGVSGPQVVEGWYGQPFDKPLARTREYVDIIRKVLRREEPVTNDGPHYPLPYPGGTGLGKPLKSIVHPLRADIPILLAAEGQKNVQLATEICEGWMPIFYSPYKTQVYEQALANAPKGFEIPCVVSVVVTDDVQAGLDMLKWAMALYIGGMGAREKNFHFDVVGRMGYADEAKKVQDLYLDGRKEEAAKAVPDELVDEISLIGPASRIKDRMEAWISSPVTTLITGTRDPAALKVLADILG
ncbi:MAG TPA: LLM class F420-dependent oxidoreductase [Actinomycetota bacterium]|nr:LLM class F420-dependent oxidoreductase [Actinomycetota bacterium]